MYADSFNLKHICRDNSGAVNIAKFLTYAKMLAEDLNTVHKRGEVYRYLRPENIVFDENSGKIELKSQYFLYEGKDFLYQSPEHSERIRMEVDNRSDLYVLGLIYYEMLTGVFPFSANTAEEMIHNHLAMMPISPVEKWAQIPKIISQMVITLLEKDMFRRYQTADVLISDLDIVSQYYETNGAFPRFLPNLLITDVSYFKSDKLYGREDIIFLFDELHKRMLKGESNAFCILGEAGNGKSSMLDYLIKSIDSEKVFVAKSRYNVRRRDLPYSGLIHAINALIQRIMTEPEENLTAWREILNTLSEEQLSMLNGLIPSLQFLTLIPADNQKQGCDLLEREFIQAIESFLKLLVTYGKPLVICLDDLHWADSSSLKLIDYFVTEESIDSLLFVCSSKESEIDFEKPFFNLIRDEEKITVAHVKPLSSEHVREYLTDKLQITEKKSIELESIFSLKTGRNPFFMEQFLSWLYTEGVLFYSIKEDGWHWRKESLHNVQIADNMVQFITDSVEVLREDMGWLLHACAVYGRDFSVSIICDIFKFDEFAVREALLAGVKDGAFLISGDDLYQFSHDRIVDVIYSFISEEDRVTYHLMIAKYLDEHRDKNSDIFHIISHYNKALKRIKKDEQKIHVAKLNIDAARKARTAMAFESSLEYIDKALHLLNGVDIWSMNPDVAFESFFEKAGCEFLFGDIVRAENTFSQLLSRNISIHNKVDIHIERSELYIKRSHFNEAAQAAYSGLKIMGISKKSILFPRVVYDYLKLRFYFRGDAEKTLKRLPENNNPLDNKKLHLFSNLITALMSQGNYFRGIAETLKAAGMITRKGNSPYAPLLLTAYSSVLVLRGEISKAYEIATQAQKNVNPLIHTRLMLKAMYLYADAILIWKKPVQESLNYCMNIFELAVRYGDSSTVSLSFFKYLLTLFYNGEAPESILRIYDNNNKVIEEHFAPAVKYLLDAFIFDIKSLRDDTGEKPYQLKEGVLKSGNLQFSGFYLYNESLNQFILGNYETVLRNYNEFLTIKKSFARLIYGVEWLFIVSLAHLFRYVHTGKRVSGAEKIIRKTRDNLENLGKHCAENFSGRAMIIKGAYRLFCDDPKGQKLLEQGVTIAQKQGHIYVAAATCELLSIFEKNKGNHIASNGYLIHAGKLYQRWGAYEKVKSMKKEHNLFTFIDNDSSNEQYKSKYEIDARALIDSSLVIAQEIELEKLKEKILRIVFTISGARKAQLIFRKDRKLIVEAERYTENEEVFYIEPNVSINDYARTPRTIIRYVINYLKPLVLTNALKDDLFNTDSYVVKEFVQSVLCVPVMRQDTIIAVLYLENNLLEGAFSPVDLNLIKHLSTQIAVSLENASLYADLKKEIKQHKIAEEERTMLERQLYQSQKLEAVGTLANGIAHDFNNVLGSILGFTEIALDEYNDDHPITPLKQIHEASLRAKTIVQGILEFSRQAVKRKTSEITDLIELVDETVSFVEPGIPPGVSIKKNIECEKAEIAGESAKLHQVLSNLYINAFHAMEKDGGLLTISLDHVRNDVIRENIPIKTSFYYAISVTDTGSGIDKDVMEHIFEPYFTTKPVGKGSGMGLSICYSIVKKMGGVIDVESEKGVGTSFVIYLPEITADTQVTEENISAWEIQGGSERILLVDDEHQMMTVMKIKLSKMGYNVIAFNKSPQALEAFRENPSEYDIVVTDLNMPELSGEQLIREIHHDNPDIPAIMVSGYFMEEEREKWIEKGFNAIISKPVSFNELDREIRRIFD